MLRGAALFLALFFAIIIGIILWPGTAYLYLRSILDNKLSARSAFWRNTLESLALLGLVPIMIFIKRIFEDAGLWMPLILYGICGVAALAAWHLINDEDGEDD